MTSPPYRKTPPREDLPPVGAHIGALDQWYRHYTWGELVVVSVNVERQSVLCRRHTFGGYHANEAWPEFISEEFLAFDAKGGVACRWNYIHDLSPEDRKHYDDHNQELLDFLDLAAKPDFALAHLPHYMNAINRVRARYDELIAYRDRFMPEVTV